MWLWVIAILAVVIGYVYSVLTTSSGSSFEDNSIDAFIEADTDNQKIKTPSSTSNSSDRYKTNYTVEGRQILIVYGTEYGFSEEVSRKLFDRILDIQVVQNDPPFQPRLLNAKDYTYMDWNQEQVCFVVISTSGDGVPPTDARPFVEHLNSRTEVLGHICYSVLALGDTNYPQFCKTGKSVDESFRRLSATCVTDRHDVDMEDWSVISDWMDKVILYLAERSAIIPQMDYLDLSDLGHDGVPNRHNPFMTTYQVKKMLTIQTSVDDKETIHCEFDITGSGLTWTSGDALGIYPQNNPLHVTAILQALKHGGIEEVNMPTWAYKPCSDHVDLHTALLKFYDLKHVKVDLLQLLYKSVTDITEKQELEDLLHQGTSKNNTFLYEYLEEREVVDVLTDFKSHQLLPQQLLNVLKQLQPRYYSISSSPVVDSNTVCVTAAVVRYELLGQSREGVTTTYLHDRLQVYDTCPVFMSRNPDFRLPSDNTLPVILIGPGTGIAPFRAFIQEKALTENSGPVYLYFGCRHREKDFLYREELESWQKDGLITLRVAFSRDQKHKIYVQDLLLEDSEVLWQLINQDNAHIYVCGDAKHMAHDVHQGLMSVLQTHGHMDVQQSAEYLQTLEKESRYQKDVWVT